VVVALNKSDLATDIGYEIDADELSRLLGVPVVPTVATTKQGMEELKDAIIEASRAEERPRLLRIDYGKKAEELIKSVEELIRKDLELSRRYPTRWLAIRVLEGDEDVLRKVRNSAVWPEIAEVIGWAG